MSIYLNSAGFKLRTASREEGGRSELEEVNGGKENLCNPFNNKD